MYHFSAAEKEESAIISDKDDGDDVAANSEAGTDSGDSVAVNKEDASEGVKELCEQILNLDIVEMNQLLFRLQSRLGISDQMLAGVGSGGGGGGGAGGDAAPVEEVKVKDSFDVKLTAFDPKAKIKIIKEVRAISGLGLKEAKELVEKAPTVVKDGLSKDEAEKLAAVLTELGGSVELV
jgi:large subunit ribosomal protein L7/L12